MIERDLKTASCFETSRFVGDTQIKKEGIGGVMNGNLEVLKKRRLGRFEEDEIGECHSFEPRGLKEKDIGEI